MQDFVTSCATTTTALAIHAVVRLLPALIRYIMGDEPMAHAIQCSYNSQYCIAIVGLLLGWETYNIYYYWWNTKLLND